jgi:CRISPR/Cas system CSM-associated protein Csm5 (group 7 of RAMP superfamily)
MLKIIRSKETSEINEDNLNTVRREASRHFRNKKRQYMKDKINELAMNSNNKNIRDLYRGINKVKRCYQPRNN